VGRLETTGRGGAYLRTSFLAFAVIFMGIFIFVGPHKEGRAGSDVEGTPLPVAGS